MQKMNEVEIQQQLEKLEGWEYIDGSLEITFEFKNFKEAFSTMTRIAFECEAQQHHPDWSNVYNTLNIRLKTHDVGGVSENDFKLAKSIEAIIESE